MRQAVNNLQSTWSGFGFVSGDNVFRVVDSPHPIKVQAMIKACWEGKVDLALDTLNELWYVKRKRKKKKKKKKPVDMAEHIGLHF